MAAWLHCDYDHCKAKTRADGPHEGWRRMEFWASWSDSGATDKDRQDFILCPKHVERVKAPLDEQE